MCLFTIPILAAPVNLRRLLEGVENRYNTPKTLQLSFEQSYTGHGRRNITESGQLYLRKPGRMRWEYSSPKGKLFLSDGKDIYFYSPSANRVEQSKVKESGDMRAPLAFLMGRIDFYRDFREFRTKPEGENVRILALPKSDKSPYQEVEFLVTPEHRIIQLTVTGQDHSVMRFRFDSERLNPPLKDSQFEFRMPPGADMVRLDAEGQD